MKIISKNKKNILIIFSVATILFTITKFTLSFAMQNYYNVDFTTGLVTATTLNVRCGPGTFYKTITTSKKNEYIRVFAGIGDWYIVQVEGDYIGAVSKKYVKPIYPNSSNTMPNTANNQNENVDFSQDEKEVFELINNQRNLNGLNSLKLDNEVQRVARIKAQDMVSNNYFSHQSPTYGSPFDMLKSFKISYSSAGENIAGNSSNKGAVNAWMNSPGHKANILNTSFTRTGIGVVSSNKYGKIFVQIFINK